MKMNVFLFRFLFAFTVFSASVLPLRLAAEEVESNNALSAVQNFMGGYYLKDEAALRKALPPESDVISLLDHPDLSGEKQVGFRLEIEGIRLGKSYPSAIADPNRAILTYKMGEHPWLLPVLRVGDAWRIDPRYALAAKSGFSENEARGVIRRFAIGLFSRDKKALASIVLLRTEKELDAMLKENKLGYEDRERLAELASLMAIAPTRTGEELRFPNGEIRTALNDETEQSYVALIGMCELPFRVKNIDGLWKVVPQPYAQSLKSVGMAR